MLEYLLSIISVELLAHLMNNKDKDQSSRMAKVLVQGAILMLLDTTEPIISHQITTIVIVAVNLQLSSEVPLRRVRDLNECI